jgi:N utilization substance protein A
VPPRGGGTEFEMSKALFDALKSLSDEYGIPPETLIEKTKQGILKAVKKEFPDYEDVAIEINPDKNKFEVVFRRLVVEGEPSGVNEISLESALEVSKKAKTGDLIPQKLSPVQFGRVAAQYAKQSIRHDIREFERERLLELFKDKEHEAISATVQKVEPGTGNVSLMLDKEEIYLFKNEQIPGERFSEGKTIKVYVVGIVNAEKKPTLKLSRTHKDLVKRLFEIEIPEIYDGTVEVRAISREAGARTKIAVSSKDPNVDPVGSCIGPKYSRIKNITDELCGEKIDVIAYDENPEGFIANALAPADVINVDITDPEERICSVTVPGNQLSLAIGNKGQNAKLAARLTGYKIDIKSDGQ